jgi:tRNA threonylcarbamoyladenosine biosynthesis protein TsaE
LAAHLAPFLRARDVVGLQGDLGAGKTTFARALLHALGIDEDVPSPTFTLVQNYAGKVFPIYHFDLYRLKSASELEEIGWDDACADGLVLVEWPERAASYMPHDGLDILFNIGSQNHRVATLTPRGLLEKRFEGFGA